ncbi:cellulose synthase complex periplasmic endoglucanase BcsZ [Stenotrophomonas sp. TWI700]|uniref:cellulose synthase complex periplasmic endoglucanase BcsZ n=1 Tax=Stenotrophomonas sp. TWI700 TaxID=3136792 RepID=UPI00320B5B4A
MANSAEFPSLRRRRLMQAIAAVGVAVSLPDLRAATGSARGKAAWLEWGILADSSLSSDGRMIDRSASDLRTTSEGQSYALFFALVSNDQAQFDRILGWTVDNLAGGDMSKRLPAWLWGRDEAGRWRVLDDNPASDSDLWLAYTLIEAARLWRRPALLEVAKGMLAQVCEREIVDLPGLGPMLLPGAQGFVEEDYWRLNPSYLPMPLLRRFAGVDTRGPWPTIARNTLRMLQDTAPKGFAPDWTAWRSSGFFADPVKGAMGSYDAIRVYLWAGMTDPRDPAFKPALAALHGPLARLREQATMVERVDTRAGTQTGTGPYGFTAAVLPYLQAQGESALATRLRATLPEVARLRADPPAYYSHNLLLFGSGWFDRRYRFRADGQLRPSWA